MSSVRARFKLANVKNLRASKSVNFSFHSRLCSLSFPPYSLSLASSFNSLKCAQSLFARPHSLSLSLSPIRFFRATLSTSFKLVRRQNAMCVSCAVVVAPLSRRRRSLLSYFGLHNWKMHKLLYTNCSSSSKNALKSYEKKTRIYEC